MPPNTDTVANPFYTPEESAAILARFRTNDPVPAVAPVAAGPSPVDLRITKLQEKLSKVLEASKEKVAAINEQRVAIAGQSAAIAAEMKAQENSWVGKMGLDPNGIVGGTVNLISGALAGGSRQIVGATAALPFSWDAMTNDLGLTQKHVDAYNRYMTGKATKEDMAILGETKEVSNPANIGGMPGDVMNAAPLKTTVLDAMKGAESSRKIARGINDTFNIDSIEHQGSKNQLDSALSGGFHDQWDKITAAYNNGSLDRPEAKNAVAKGNIDLGTTKYPRGATTVVTDKDGNTVLIPVFDAKTGNGIDYEEAMKRYKETGQNLGTFKNAADAMKYDVAMADSSMNKTPKQGMLARSKDMASGIAGLLINAGDAAIHNKMGVAQYVSENAPQLLLGAFGAAGKAGMAASNIGYAADYYQKGIENFQKDNNGQLPDTNKMTEIAGWAASLAVMEHLGDEVGVHAMKLGKKAVATGAEEAAKTGFLQAAKRSLLSGVEGAIGETGTEGYQTYAEGRAETSGYTDAQLASGVNAQGKALAGKRATAEDIYKGAVIGGLSGGILSGGVHGLSEMTGTSETQVADRQEKIDKAKVFSEAVKSNDPSVYLDANSKAYNPAMAVGVLHQAAIHADATPELKNQNFDKATELVQEMEKKSEDLKATIKTGTPAEVKAARAEMAKLAPQITDSGLLWDRLYSEVMKTQTEGSVQDQVKAANVPVKTADDTQLNAAQAGTDSVINLSMASTNHITPQQADQLAGNMDNGLSTEQRDFLRSFSEARIAYNEAQDIKTVNKKVMVGDAQDMGIAKYRDQIGRALATGDQKTATKLLGLLTDFATSHVEKAAAAQEAFDQHGDAGQVYKTAQGWGAAAPKTYKTQDLLNGGGLPVVKPGLLKAINAEAKALAATRDEMTHAVNLKFGGQAKTGVVQSAAPAVNVPPQKVSAQDHAEDKTRLSVPQTDASAKPPLPSKEKVVHEGKSFATAKEADKYVHDNFLGNSHELVRNADKKGYTIQAKQKTAEKAAPKSVLAGEDKQAVIDAAIAKATENPNNGGKPRNSETPVAPSPLPSPASSVAGAPSSQDGTAALAEKPNRIDNIKQEISDIKQHIKDDTIPDWFEVKEHKNSTIADQVLQQMDPSGDMLMENDVQDTVDQITNDPRGVRAAMWDFKKKFMVATRESLLAQLDTTDSTNATKGQNHEQADSNQEAGQRQARGEGQGQEALQVTPAAEPNIQQEAGEQPANTASAVEAPVAQTAPAVEAIGEKSEPGTPYQLKKLGDFFTQAKTLLGTVKNALSLASTPEELAAQAGLNPDTLTMEQGAALRAFMDSAKGWEAQISAMLVNRGKPDYNYEDAMQFFIRPDGDIEQNLKTAMGYAIFSYIAENFGGKAFNTNDAINSVLGRTEGSYVDPNLYQEFKDVKASMPAVIDSLGQRIVMALGLKENADTPVNELARLATGLGTHAMRVLTDGANPLMVMHTVPQQQMAAIRAGDKKVGNVGLNTGAQVETFMIVNRDAERVPTKQAAAILKSVEGSKGIINELFAIESNEKPPTFEPVKKLRAFAKRTEQEVPSFLNKILKALNNQKNFLRQDALEVLQVLGDDLYLKIAGSTDVDSGVHIANRESLEARNEGLRRELDNMKTFVKDYLGNDLNQAFYFEHYAMKQQRVGITNSLVNPQLSKIHRFMVYRNSWVSTVDMADRASMENFVLRAAEGIGIKTEKENRPEALAKFKTIYTSDKMQAGIAAMNKIHTGETLNAEEKQAIVDAVGNNGAHGLDSLIALATYDRAAESKATTFKVNMLSEVDGVTNGPMLSHLLMGAAGSVKDLFAMLNRGGFYETAKAQFNDWRSTAGNQDLYETTSGNTLDMKDRMIDAYNAGDEKNGIDPAALAPVMQFMGKLKDASTGAILKAGRDMIKTPLTAMVYGSGIKTAIEGMAQDFIANIYKQMESTYALRDTDSATAIKQHEATVKALAAMGVKVPAHTGLAEIMDLKFSKNDEETLIDHFMGTLGKAVEATIREDFKHLLEIRQRFNATASLTFDMYNAAYEGLRNQLIEELVKKGEIAATSKDTPLHDLLPKHEDILDARMAKITPVLQTAMSNLSGDANAHTGMLVAKSGMEPSKALAYKSVVHFAKGFKGGKTESLIAYARRLINTDPGVGLGATSTHSFDAAVAMTAIGTHHEVLNLHDAGGVGINDLVAQGRRMNKAVWDRAISWSPTTEMYETFMRTVKGMEALLADKNTPPEVLAALGKSMVEQSNKSSKKMDDGTWSKPINPLSFLMVRALEAKRLAFETNSIKFEGMSQMHSIAQYAVEDGQYDVTEDNRKEAISRLNKETAEMLPQDIASVNAVMDAIKDHVEAAMMDDKAAQAAKKAGIKPKEIKTSDLGTLGKSVVTSDQKLVNFFRKGPSRSVQEVAAFLKGQNLTGYQDKLLAALVKALGARATAYKVNFLTKTSNLKDVVELPKGPSHAWFVSKDGVNAIYVLSPDFAESGLTKETLLHELTHAALAHAIENPTEETRPLIAELEKLREKAAEVVYEMKMTHLAPAVESVQEMVAYGMTNPEFQAVLDSFQFDSATTENVWVSGFKKFIDTLVGLLFNKEHDGLSSGFRALTTNVTGLMAASAKSTASKGNLNLSMASNTNGAPTLASLNGEEMYDALATLGQTRLSPVFDAQLRTVINMMEKSVHSPLSAMKAEALKSAPQSPVEMWDKMKMAGVAEFAKGALASGFNFTEQEAFAQQQVEAVVRTALTGEDGNTTAVYRELARLYGEVREELKGRISEFHPNANQAQKLYDFVFKMEPGMGNMSDYLSRFAALGLTNHEFATLLGFNTDIKDRSLAGLSFNDKLHAIFERIMDFISSRATNTFAGQKADQKLQALVNQLVSIEQSKRIKLAHSAGVAMDSFEKMFKAGYGVGRDAVVSVASSNFFKNSSNGLIRFAGRITTVVANERVTQYLDGLQKLRDQTIRDRQGPLMGILNEGRGAHALTAFGHKLLRMTKHIEGNRKEQGNETASFARESFDDKGNYLTEAIKKSLAYGVMRTDVSALLDHFTKADGTIDMKGIGKLYSDPATLRATIADFESRLSSMQHAKAYQNGAKALGVYLATNEVGAENLRFNADNIAAMFGTEFKGNVAPNVVTAAAAIIDPLASLYAIAALDSVHIATVNAVFAKEDARTDGGHGIEMMLKLHKDLQIQSKERLFEASGALRMKGYTPEVYNPFIRIEVANAVDKDPVTGKTKGQVLEAHGYQQGHAVQMDTSDPGYSDKMKIFKLRDGGMIQYLSGIFSYTGMNRRGTSTHDGDLGLMSTNGLMNRKKMDRIAADQKNGIRNQSVSDIDPKGTAKKKNFLVPVFNQDGDITNYRYMMNAATKDAVLDRNNDFDHLFGVMAASIYDKEKSAEQNKVAVKALHEQYTEDFSKNPGSYMQVGPNSSDKESREVWRMLPESTKQAVREVWGTNAMMVRYDMLDMTFGYRKNSAATAFGIPEDERTNFQQAYVQLLEGFLGQKAGLYVRRTEEGWQQLVKEAKDTMVVKSGMTLLGNYTSNISEMLWFGVPVADIWRHQRVALKGITMYRKDSEQLNKLEQAVRLKHLEGRSIADVNREIVRLRDALERNPVKVLIDAGMMPTIVEDISEEDDRYTYKGQFTKKIDDVVGNLNPHVLKAAKFMVMAHDTPIYKALSYGTQVSDFVARYTLYQHILTRENNPLKGDEALQLVSDAFVNYDVPSHRDVQYANDMGLVYFTKYYLRIQKVIALLYRQNPGRAMMLLTLGHFLDFLPMLTHSAMLQRIGNPFSTGAFEALSSMNEMLTIKTLMYPFR